MSGPVPSTLLLLSDLDSVAHGAKVRFLGCVDGYLVKTATLRLRHAYPASAKSTLADVNLVHVLERIKGHEMDVGTWVNVIGYVERRREKGVFVQAIAVWDAGDVDLEAYQRAVEARKKAG